MRDVWREQSDGTKLKILPCKTSVHPMFSTSFGLHVAVITADEPPLFVFTRRAKRGKLNHFLWFKALGSDLTTFQLFVLWLNS